MKKSWLTRCLTPPRRPGTIRNRPGTDFRPRLESLEGRWVPATTVTINGPITLDESVGVQNTGSPAPGDADDSDVSLGTLQSQALTFYDRLGSGGLALSTAFPDLVGVGRSTDDFISVSADGTIISLAFSKPDGQALPVRGGGEAGVASGLSAVNGGAVSLFADAGSGLGSRLVLGVDTAGDIAIAMFMQPTAGLSAARVWTVQLEPLSNPDATNPDDPVIMGGLGVAAGVSLDFNFDALPSGQNLFGTVGSTATGLVVIGKVPVLNADGTYTNASNTINTSQGGGPTTIGVDNQMFDAGEGAYFTFVKSPVPNYLAGAAGGLTQGEADDADNIQYTGGTLPVSSAFVRVSQIQANTPATMRITAYDMGGAPQGQAFATTGLGTGPAVAITAVRVYDAGGQPVANPQVAIAGGVATVAGLGAGYRVEWDTAAPHDQVLIEAVAGKFDIGGFGANQSAAAATPLTGIRFEDDGPAITATAVGAPTLAVDETLLATNASGAFAAQFTPAFGADGAGATPRTYALSTPGGASGLVDTATGQAVMLSLVGGQVQGRTATSNDLVFTVGVDAGGNVTLDQIRAVVHPNTSSHDEAVTLAAAGLVVLTGTAHDGDADSASAPLNIGQLLAFEDAGPAITASATNAPTLTVDETLLATNAAGAFAAQFTPVFGADGPGATPRTYALSTPGGASGLVDTATGQAVMLSLVGGQVQGRTATSNDLVFTVGVDAGGNVTLDQIRAVVHPNTSSHDEAVTLAAAGLVVLTGTAHDGDADSASAPLSIGQLLAFEDDGPAIGDIANGIVDFAAGSSVEKTLNGAVGADPNGGPYTIDDFTGSLVVNGVTLTGVRSADQQAVSYWADTNNNGTIGDAGDTEFYRLTLNQGGAGTYKFEVLVNPPPANISFDFSTLPSGQNLFGMIGDPTAGLIVFGKAPVINADGTYTNASNTINTSQGGGGTTIGVDNQMFDPGEGAYFTFVKQPDTEYLSLALDPGEADDADNMLYGGGTLEVDNGFLNVVQTQGGGAKTMRLSAWNVAGSPQGRDLFTAARSAVNITEVRVNGVVVFSGIAASVDVNVAAGDVVSWETDGLHDQVLVEGVAGKWDIGGFGTTQGAPTPDQVLHFVVRVTDGDADSATDDFFIGIDGTGIHDDGQVSGVSVATASELATGGAALQVVSPGGLALTADSTGGDPSPTAAPTDGDQLVLWGAPTDEAVLRPAPGKKPVGGAGVISLVMTLQSEDPLAIGLDGPEGA